MSEIKLIKKDTDLSKLNLKPYDWDVVINGRPYYVVRLVGFIHTIGGKYGQNNLWAYPRDEEPNYENLVEFNCENPVSYGIRYSPSNGTKCKWDECEAISRGSIMITRNGEDFYDVRCGINYGIDKARVLISEILEHPLNISTIDFDKKMIGRKLWWRSEPAVITYYCKGQAAIVLEPCGIKKFTVPAEFYKEDGEDYYCDGDVKTSIFDNHIWWFRE